MIEMSESFVCSCSPDFVAKGLTRDDPLRHGCLLQGNCGETEYKYCAERVLYLAEAVDTLLRKGASPSVQQVRWCAFVLSELVVCCLLFVVSHV